MKTYYVFAITKDEIGNIQSFYVMNSNYGNVKIFSYEKMKQYLLEGYTVYTAIWYDDYEYKWLKGKELQLMADGVIRTIPNRRTIDNLESLPTFIE